MLITHRFVTDSALKRNLGLELNNGERKGRESPIKTASRPPAQLRTCPSAPWSAQSTCGRPAAGWGPHSPSAPRTGRHPWPAGAKPESEKKGGSMHTCASPSLVSHNLLLKQTAEQLPLGSAVSTSSSFLSSLEPENLLLSILSTEAGDEVSVSLGGLSGRLGSGREVSLMTSLETCVSTAKTWGCFQGRCPWAQQG